MSNGGGASAVALAAVLAGSAAWMPAHPGSASSSRVSLDPPASPDGQPTLLLEIDLDPGTRRLQATAWMRPEVRDFRFALHQSLAVTQASADAKALAVIRLETVGNQPVNHWRVQVPANADQIRIDYRGTLPALDASLDHRGVLRGLPPMASGEGSFLPAGSAWYPRAAAPFAYRASVSVPADQRALVPGRLVSEELPMGGTGRYRAVFEFSHPAGGIDLMAGPWIVRERIVPRHPAAAPSVPGDSRGALRLRTYLPRELDATAGLADGYLEDTRRYLERYAERIGAYPFTGFSVVASPLPTGFGMPTLTYLGAEVLKLPFIRATSLGHEVLHNWWGNGVFVDDGSGNWSEGLTTFMADYAYNEEESAEAARQVRLAWLRDFAAVAPEARQPLASFRSRTHGADASVGYGKSAMLFVMLRDRIGDDAFRLGIRRFWETHRFRGASWDDLRTAFEQASGESLAEFFAQWLQRRGGPSVRIVDATAMRVANRGAGQDAGGFMLSLSLEQSAPAYALRIPVEIVYPDRSETRWIDFRRPRDSVTVEAKTLPNGVRLDPDLRVWRLLDAEQLPPILRQWIVARSPRLAQVSVDEDVRGAAMSLAGRLFENRPQPAALDRLDRSSEPLLLAGVHADVDAALERTGLPPRPANLAGRGSAVVWTIAREGRAPVAVVSAKDADALRALLRPLPHYGGQSWLVFEGGRMIERGVWPAAGRPVPVAIRR